MPECTDPSDDPVALYCRGMLSTHGIRPRDLEELARQILDSKEPVVLLGFNECARHLVNLCHGRVEVLAIADPRREAQGCSFRGIGVLDFPAALALPARRYAITDERDNFAFADLALQRHPGRRVLAYPAAADAPRYHLDAARHLPWLRFMERGAPPGMGMTPSRLVFLCEALRQCLGLPGDVVEVGVFQGCSAWHLARILEQFAPDKRLLLCDWFEELPPTQPTAVMCLDQIRRQVGCAQAEWLTGDVAQHVERLRASSLCFAHLDVGLNVAPAVEAVFDSMVEGGILLLDNFAEMRSHLAVRFTHWFRARGHPIAAVPDSTQGWVIKRSAPAGHA